MTESDRTRVGRALDDIRDALAPFVDAAMTAAYGTEWNDRVAREDAQRRPSGKQLPVAKSDLAVLLKAIQFQRIAPWGDGRADPRIRSYSSELLSLRNLFAHGDDCTGEAERLLDTAGRLLRLLGLDVPSGLTPQHDDAGNSEPVSALVPVPPSLYDQRLADEVARMGAIGERLSGVWSRAGAISESFMTMGLLALASADERSEQIETARDLVVGLGGEVLDFLDEVASIERRIAEDSTALRAFALATRLTLAGFPWSQIALMAATVALARVAERGDEGLADYERSFGDRVARLGELRRSRREKWGELVILCRKLNDGELLPNILIVMANLELSDDAEPPEQLELTQDSVARVRILAAAHPGSAHETHLVQLLRREGALCNDLGRADEAVRAFARADEIVDRYPAADPDL